MHLIYISVVFTFQASQSYCINFVVVYSQYTNTASYTTPHSCSNLGL
jgi:hypothetical protein